MLFADRLEILNPGDLPTALTTESLRAPHASIPRNPLIAEPLFLTRYIEKAGSGTLDMIARCRAAGLREPEFDLRSGQFVLTLLPTHFPDRVRAPPAPTSRATGQPPCPYSRVKVGRELVW